MAVALLATFSLSFVSSSALARGSVRVAQSTITEADGEWKLKFTIDYGAMPHLAHIPMVFSFKQTAIYERSMTDETGDKPVERTVPVQNATPINLPMDVGFADMSGKMFKITKFGMKLTRDADFEAGEYTLTVKLAAGGTLGQNVRLMLRGKNKAVDRRSMVFEAKPPPKKNGAKEAAATDDGDGKPKAAEDYTSDLSGIEDISAEEAAAIQDPDAPPPVEQKQGGCGCRVAGQPPVEGGWLLALAVGAALTLRRRSRSL
jgi:MYXO-CTERM domain-containing protein